MSKKENKGIYIRSIQASKAFEHSEREGYFSAKYNGMIPYSLQTIKLDNVKGFNKKQLIMEGTKKEPVNWKYLSNSLINLKFDNKVKSGAEILPKLKISLNKKKIKNYLVKATDDENKIKKLEESIENLEKYIERIESEIKEKKWEEKSKGILRSYLYKNGFTVTTEKKNKRTGEVKKSKTTYVLFQRSSSKSRKGECLFINKDLLEPMQKWSRMGLTFKENAPTDIVSLRAYESLIGSGLESTVHIDVDNILLVDDVKSIFERKVKVVETEKNGKLEVNYRNKKIENDIWDGESLLDHDTFFEGKDYSFILLRQHMFKSAGFSFKIQKFLRDKAKELGIDFDTWIIRDMYGNPILASNVKMITTPNSCKFLKFAYLKTVDKFYTDYKELSDKKKFKAEKAMYEHWKKAVRKDGQIFGVCKHEKESSHSFLEEDKDSVNRLSYQILNTLIATKEDIKVLALDELNYIEQLKNNIDVFIDYIDKTSNDNNSNQLYINLYKINNETQYTKMFKKFRATQVNSYIKKLKSGSIKIKDADYTVMCSNPIELAYHALGLLDKEALKPITLKGDEVYTTLFPFCDDVVGHRNPHTSPSNLYMAKNTYNKMISDYMPITKNVVVVNAIETLLQEITSGSDFDSDSLLLSNNKKLIELGEVAKEKYMTVVSGIKPKQANDYSYSPESMAEADEKISVSGRLIGEVANLGQYAVSIHNFYRNLNYKNIAKEILTEIDKVCSLSTCVIDMAKRSFYLNIQSEITGIRNKLNKYTMDIIIVSKYKVNKKAKHKLVDKVKIIKVECKSFKHEKFTIIKPNFFRYVEAEKIEEERRFKKEKKVKVIYENYLTPMDFLQEVLSEIKYANRSKTIDMKKLLNPNIKRSDSNRHQIPVLYKLGESISKKFDDINAEKLEMEDRMDRAIEIACNARKELSKMKISSETILTLIEDMYSDTNKSKRKDKVEKNVRLINLLFETHHDNFVNVFS
ncbi:hypothetical protein QH639_14945 [Lysinibacillus sp. 1 U-2021]|uniref:hypothetical protein n=1 Tax=Lysinibacillus sp. 1 U-2021 TaxID=3039426 RepID=UPI00248135B8|nr:hypothetical protein [Lysinibacillus sp. 1 U-2021]WGT37143.1 hypothetical protein QH639_14945 [Lysinibacillus sp. 1 U-2021]